MSRVRVYELAKEAGMGSKELADKLIAAGYEIKGHSSTVDEDTADKIRKTMFKKAKAKPKPKPEPEAEAEKVEKRIEGEGDQKSTVIRRRTTIIRRRAKAEPEALEEAAEESAEQEADEALETKAVSDPADVAETAENDAGQEAAATLEEESESAEVRQEAADEIDEAEVEEGDTEAEEIAAADAPAEEDAAAEKEDSLKIKQPKKVERKKIAKVVGTIELPTPRERDKTDQQRPKGLSNEALPGQEGTMLQPPCSLGRCPSPVIGPERRASARRAKVIRTAIAGARSLRKERRASSSPILMLTISAVADAVSAAN